MAHSRAAVRASVAYRGVLAFFADPVIAFFFLLAIIGAAVRVSAALLTETQAAGSLGTINHALVGRSVPHVC